MNSNYRKFKPTKSQNTVFMCILLSFTTIGCLMTIPLLFLISYYNGLCDGTIDKPCDNFYKVDALLISKDIKIINNDDQVLYFINYNYIFDIHMCEINTKIYTHMIDIPIEQYDVDNNYDIWFDGIKCTYEEPKSYDNNNRFDVLSNIFFLLLICTVSWIILVMIYVERLCIIKN